MKSKKRIARLEEDQAEDRKRTQRQLGYVLDRLDQLEDRTDSAEANIAGHERDLGKAGLITTNGPEGPDAKSDQSLLSEEDKAKLSRYKKLVEEEQGVFDRLRDEAGQPDYNAPAPHAESDEEAAGWTEAPCPDCQPEAGQPCPQPEGVDCYREWTGECGNPDICPDGQGGAGHRAGEQRDGDPPAWWVEGEWWVVDDSRPTKARVIRRVEGFNAIGPPGTTRPVWYDHGDRALKPEAGSDVEADLEGEEAQLRAEIAAARKKLYSEMRQPGIASVTDQAALDEIDKLPQAERLIALKQLLTRHEAATKDAAETGPICDRCRGSEIPCDRCHGTRIEPEAENEPMVETAVGGTRRTVTTLSGVTVSVDASGISMRAPDGNRGIAGRLSPNHRAVLANLLRESEAGQSEIDAIYWRDQYRTLETKWDGCRAGFRALVKANGRYRAENARLREGIERLTEDYVYVRPADLRALLDEAGQPCKGCDWREDWCGKVPCPNYHATGQPCKRCGGSGEADYDPALPTRPCPDCQPEAGQKPSTDPCPYCSGYSARDCPNIEHWKRAADYWAGVAENGWEVRDELLAERDQARAERDEAYNKGYEHGRGELHALAAEALDFRSENARLREGIEGADQFGLGFREAKSPRLSDGPFVRYSDLQALLDGKRE